MVICGDRNWKDAAKIKKRLELLPWNAEVIEGGCHGADLLAAVEARKLGLKVTEVLADWTTLGLKAGPVRNRVMLDLKPALVLAFHANLDASKGTKDCVGEARRRGIPVEIIT